MRPHTEIHPLTAFFHSRKFTENEGMNWLQGNGYISDLCVKPEDVCPVDVDRVLRLAGAEIFIPTQRRNQQP